MSDKQENKNSYLELVADQLDIALNWKVFTMRVVLAGLALFIVAVLLPGLKVHVNNLPHLLLFLLGYGILNAVAKPVIQLLTISLLFVTYGLVIIIINILVLWLLGLFFPNVLEVTGLIPAVFAGLLLGIIILFLESIFGVTPPILDDQHD